MSTRGLAPEAATGLISPRATGSILTADTRSDAYAMWWLVQVLQLSRLSCCACLYVHLLRVGWLTSQPAPRRPSPISSLGQRAHSNRLSVAVLLGPRLVVVNHHEPRASCGDSCHALCQAIFAARGFRAHCDNLLRSANVSMSMRNASLSLAVSRFPALVVPMRHART